MASRSDRIENYVPKEFVFHFDRIELGFDPFGGHSD